MTLQEAFILGLSEEIKDELPARDEIDSLETLIYLVVRLDNFLRERKREGILRDLLPIPNPLN